MLFVTGFEFFVFFLEERDSFGMSTEAIAFRNWIFEEEVF